MKKLILALSLVGLSACNNNKAYEGENLVLLACNGQQFEVSGISKVEVTPNGVKVLTKTEGEVFITNATCVVLSK